MKNRDVGIIVLIIAAFIGFMTYSFNQALSSIVNASCSHGPDCPMWGTVDFQTNVSIAVMILVIGIGIFLIVSGRQNKPQTHIHTHNFEEEKKDLIPDEKKVFEKIIDSDGTIFQSELTDRTELSKVRITRILDKLEGKGLIERKRRGMTNVVILKHRNNH